MPTTRSAIAAVAMAAVLVLAGCSGPLSNGTATAGPAGETPAGAVDATDGGTVEFYISDEENVIDDFEHLNVTITMVGLHRTGDADGEDDADRTETETEAATASGTITPDTATVSPTGTPTDSPVATATRTEDGEETDDADEEEGDDGKEGEESDDKAGDDGKGDAEWVEYEVNKTVDLTELKGANATKLEALAAPDGSYDKVFIYVDGIEATLKNGESVNVKLPSNKLQVNKGFTVGNGENVSFVFDLAVHKAGKSGKYILQPVISQSGTGDEVEIDDVDEEKGETDDDDADEEAADDGEMDDEDETEEPAETEEPEATETEEQESEGNGESGENPILRAPT